MAVTRRGFAFSALAFAGCKGGAFSIVSGKRPPRLVCGVLSDVHVDKEDNAKAFRNALEWFRAEHVDAVVIAGDLTTDSTLKEFDWMARVYFSVFPRGRHLDGTPVERLFVTGNHDVDVLQKFKSREEAEEKSFTFHRSETWERLFEEEYLPITRKDVKGVPFVLKNWCCRKLKEKSPVKAYFEKFSASLPHEGPLFYIQHDHPRGTCSWPGAKDCCDSGDTTECLSKYHDAIALSGHSHFSIANETSIWQGAFTSVGTGSTCGWGFTDGGRENGHGGADLKDRMWEMPYLDILRCRQAQIMRVYDDCVAFERRDVEFGLSLGVDRIVPLGAGAQRPYAFQTRASKATPPQFADNASGQVRIVPNGRDRAGNVHAQVVVEFPPVNGLNGGVRAYDYHIEADECLADGSYLHILSRDVYSHNALLPAEKDIDTCACAIALSNLPRGKIRFKVEPRGEWGETGRALFIDFANS